MTGVAVRETVTLAGRAERARLAREFAGGVLGPGHPCGDDAEPLVSELFGNSVRHSGSGAPCETVTVAVRTGDGFVRVEVTDRSGPGRLAGHTARRDDAGRGARPVSSRLPLALAPACRPPARRPGFPRKLPGLPAGGQAAAG